LSRRSKILATARKRQPQGTDADPDPAGLLEIGAVARELGIAPSTLRTWERRYRVVVPQRGRRGQRLYDPEQVATLRRVLAQVRRGARASAAHELAVIPSPLGTASARIQPSMQAPLKARQTVDGLLGELDDPRFAFYLRLVASELVKNAFLHGSSRHPIRMDAKLFHDAAELRVQNGGGRLTLRMLRRRRRDGGRGLDIVDALADAWSIDTGPLGTTITVRLSRPTPHEHECVWTVEPPG
jgi:DNA-binding transcriptional MerR regulator